MQENRSEGSNLICCCALYTGMRVLEIIELKWKNVDLEERIITIKKSKVKNCALILQEYKIYMG